MAQYRKDDVQAAIVGAALRVFAARGYEDATMQEIAREAGVSTGNVYRYFESKDALFYGVVDDAFARTFLKLLRRRVAAAEGVRDVRTLEPTAPYPLASEELLSFCIEFRLKVVILLGRARGSRYEPVAGDLLDELVRLAVAHFRELAPTLVVTDDARFALRLVYRSFLDNMVAILVAHDDERRIRGAVRAYSHYHLAGLNGLFADLEAS